VVARLEITQMLVFVPLVVPKLVALLELKTQPKLVLVLVLINISVTLVQTVSTRFQPDFVLLVWIKSIAPMAILPLLVLPQAEVLVMSTCA
jgi:hypothetical protein